MATLLAQDTFSRTVAAGSWGSAEIGGVWTLYNGDSAFSVSTGKGQVLLTANQERSAYLNDLSTSNVVIRVALSSTSVYSGGPQVFTIIGREISNAFYQARVRIEDGLLRLYLLRDEVSLSASTTITHNYAANEKIWCELSVTGTNPTAVAAKMWLDGTPEPSTWQQSANDNTSVLQFSGRFGIQARLTSAVIGSATLSFSDYTASDPSTTVLETPVVTLTQVHPTTIGGNNGSVTATWSAVSGAHHYESCLVAGEVTTGFVADDTNATSPKVYSGLSAGMYTIAVRAKASS